MRLLVHQNAVSVPSDSSPLLPGIKGRLRLVSTSLEKFLESREVDQLYGLAASEFHGDSEDAPETLYELAFASPSRDFTSVDVIRSLLDLPVCVVTAPSKKFRKPGYTPDRDWLFLTDFLMNRIAQINTNHHKHTQPIVWNGHAAAFIIQFSRFRNRPGRP